MTSALFWPRATVRSGAFVKVISRPQFSIVSGYCVGSALAGAQKTAVTKVASATTPILGMGSIQFARAETATVIEAGGSLNKSKSVIISVGKTVASQRRSCRQRSPIAAARIGYAAIQQLCIEALR